MTTTFLLDLDNTLLGNDMNIFLPAYFAALSNRLSPFTNDKDLQQIAANAVQAILANQEPTVTNDQAFTAEFIRLIGHPLAAMQPALAAFYQEDYPLLQKYTSTRPEARLVVRHLLTAGHKVVIATNPLLPTPPIEQRLNWAGIGDFPYTLVTSLENSHFAKPNPRYYQEILNKVDSTPEEAWMVGDDLKNDIAPAHSLGIKTWWLTNTVSPTNPEPAPQWDKQGPLADLLAWLESSKLPK